MTQGIGGGNDFVKTAANALKKERFVLLDVGASGGIDQGWRAFAPRLTAYAFDPSIAECARLNAAESDPAVKYIPAFVSAPKAGPIAAQRAGRSAVLRNPWNRLSVYATMKRREEALRKASHAEQMHANAWDMTELANPDAPVVLPDFLRQNAESSVDFIKIDIDSDDFDVLQTLDGEFARLGVLGVAAEVNFVGGVEPHEHTFHNTDRFMRRNGFDLFSLTTRPYSAAALPARYQLSFPAQTEFGRPIQGDAIYLRDVFQDDVRDLSFSDEKYLKLAAIYSLAQLPDMAAEILVNHRSRLVALIDVDAALNLLAQQAQSSEPKLSFKDYVAAFERDEASFYP